jgi:hypothetical protein
MVERKASWDEVSADAAATAPFGFFIFWQLDVDPSMSLNGNIAKCSEYLMGNHTIARGTLPSPRSCGAGGTCGCDPPCAVLDRVSKSRSCIRVS